MGRFMYVHFGDDVPQSIEKEYNKLLRREQYMTERDAENGLIDADFDDVLAANPDPASLPMSDYELEQHTIHNTRLDYLPVAMEMLRIDFPEGYQLIMDYYLGNDSVTLYYLMEKYGLTRPMIKYRLKLAREKLKQYIIMHENGG